uniref:Ubiquitin fusion degradation protein 1 n=1 Tax=Syphacia muris TaxID=451379 RepID=A0A0N5ALF1_9BILA
MFDMMFGGRLPARDFDLMLRAFSAPFAQAADTEKVNEINHGGKILLPPSALDLLVRLNIEYPMMFKVTNADDASRATHCGVLEFLAEEGHCYLPSWMMRQLGLAEGGVVRIVYTSLPRATYARFKPQSTDFLTVSNPRAVLEVELRKFACLTKNDMIAVEYNEQILEFLVMEVKPGNAVSIIECDMNVEFDAPEGYVEPSSVKPSAQSVKPSAPPPSARVPKGTKLGEKVFQAFSGNGLRLDGKGKSTTVTTSKATLSEPEIEPITVDTEYVPGKLSFMRYAF